MCRASGWFIAAPSLHWSRVKKLIVLYLFSWFAELKEGSVSSSWISQPWSSSTHASYLHKLVYWFLQSTHSGHKTRARNHAARPLPRDPPEEETQFRKITATPSTVNVYLACILPQAGIRGLRCRPCITTNNPRHAATPKMRGRQHSSSLPKWRSSPSICVSARLGWRMWRRRSKKWRGSDGLIKPKAQHDCLWRGLEETALRSGCGYTCKAVGCTK